MKYLSATRINMYLRCAHQYYLRYMQNIKRPPGIAAIVGRSVDASVNHNMINKRDKGKLLLLDEVQDIARDIFNTEWSNGVLITDSDKQNGNPKGKSLDKSVRLAKLHCASIAPQIKPINIQREWIVDIKGFPFQLKGITDLEEVDSVRDTKTAAKTPTQKVADLSLQLTIYSLARNVLDKINPLLYLDYLIDLKHPKAVSLKTERTKEHYEKFFKKLEIVAEGLEKEVFPPTNEEINYLCDPRFCAYYGKECKYTG
jgi:hypothetical protein